ncbi:hypothetical protein CBR_g19655 [Chara braunii]|uniref:Leucine-rich repeat-containing N-terminal plant-type domain-containing protein n=1 Tax=Chara braunii TaxID=69332 RepID=A0A388KYT2_CHABU|nr:hypothetical protein CBR_g19655 [Chara braunii]|eukprot:GBG75142.1 hypothetical protein CBR_g19655 [Chara braunii]
MSRNFGKMLPAPYRQWKLTVLFFLLLLVFASLEAGGVDSEQIEALKTIATGSPLGSLWNELRSDPCSGKWPGVGCSDSQNAIIELNLPGQKLVGNLSVEFFKLTDLRRLDLSFNSLSGQIPMKLRDLKHLEILNLAGNNLQGFPQDLLTLPKLRTLSLAHNPLGTFIPPFLKASLQSLVLQNCSLSGVIPDLRPLENLVTL